jgi:hypothetical protein
VAKYPFIPRSTTHLEPGQFWSFSLPDGTHAAGCVLAKLIHDGKLSTRMFLAGLLDWSGTTTPNANDLEGTTVIEHGAAHIKAILENGGSILGIARIDGASQAPVLMTDAIRTWGYGVIRVLAKKHFARVS